MGGDAARRVRGVSGGVGVQNYFFFPESVFHPESVSMRSLIFLKIRFSFKIRVSFEGAARVRPGMYELIRFFACIDEELWMHA